VKLPSLNTSELIFIEGENQTHAAGAMSAVMSRP
jgi:hypothetical protein